MKPEQEHNVAVTTTEEAALAQRLREAREYLGLSQEIVAEKLGIQRPAVSAIETAKRKVSSLELKQLAHLYRRTVDYFLGTASAEEPQDELYTALYRATKPLSETDREQVLRFASFLKSADKPPMPKDDTFEVQ